MAAIDCCWTSLSILVHAKSLDPDPLDSQRTLERGKVRQSLLAARNSASHFPPFAPLPFPLIHPLLIQPRRGRRGRAPELGGGGGSFRVNKIDAQISSQRTEGRTDERRSLCLSLCGSHFAEAAVGRLSLPRSLLLVLPSCVPDTNCIKKRGGGRKRHRRHGQRERGREGTARKKLHFGGRT